MKISIFIIFSLLFTSLPLSVFAADDTVEKTDCKSAIGYDSMDELQADLLLSSKRQAVNELFGELITAATAVEDFVVTSDQIRASSLGLVREDAIRYYNGDNLGEVCIDISVYTTAEDRQQFVPIRLNKRNCVSNPDMTNRELRKFAEEEAVIKALIEYNRKLEGQARDRLLNLMQQVTYLENGLLPDTDSYCVRVEGHVTPIETVALLQASDSFSAAVLLPQISATITDTLTGTQEIDLNLLVTIDSTSHHIGDNSVLSWDIPNPEGSAYMVRFWLDSDGTTEALLGLDTYNVDFANPIWINDHFIGIVSKAKPEKWKGEEWHNNAFVFIPSNVLKAGENTLSIEAMIDQGNHDDFMLGNMRLFEWRNRYHSLLSASIVLSDTTSYHIGDGSIIDWPVKDPDGTFLNKFFSIDSHPASDGLLQLSTYSVSYANSVFVNDCYVGVLPGMNDTTWTSTLSMRIPRRCMKIGINTLRIEAIEDDNSNYDDFLVKNIAILVDME